jgi:hypothetical protein
MFEFAVTEEWSLPCHSYQTASAQRTKSTDAIKLVATMTAVNIDRLEISEMFLDFQRHSAKFRDG